MDISRFENIGDNCEFGFILQRHGRTGSSLLRWSITSVPALTDAFEKDFEGLYQLENLAPSRKDMLIDRAYQLHFHSDMVRDHTFVENYRAIRAQESGKIAYLTKRLREQLADPRMIFVYKGKHEWPVSHLQPLADVIAKRNGANLLYVTTEDTMPLGHVEQRGPHLYFARIDRFADYVKVQEASHEVWDSILKNADKVIPCPERAPLSPDEGEAATT